MFCSAPGIYSHDCISLDKYGLTVIAFILILIHEGNGQKLTYFIIAERKVKMYCYEKFLPELQTEVFVLACDSKKLCRNGRVLSVSAQLNEFNLYYSELFIQAILHQSIRALFPDRP